MKLSVNEYKCPQNHRCPSIAVCPHGAITQKDSPLPSGHRREQMCRLRKMHTVLPDGRH